MDYTVEVSGFDTVDDAVLFVRRKYDVNAPIKEFAEGLALAEARRDGLDDAKVEGCWRREEFTVACGRE